MQLVKWLSILINENCSHLTVSLIEFEILDVKLLRSLSKVHLQFPPARLQLLDFQLHSQRSFLVISAIAHSLQTALLKSHIDSVLALVLRLGVNEPAGHLSQWWRLPKAECVGAEAMEKQG